MPDAVTLSATQTRVAPPSRTTRHLETVVVSNPTAALVYLNVWDDLALEGAVSPAKSVAVGLHQIGVAAGFAGTIVVGVLASGSLVLSATAAADGTGDPADDVVVSFGWVGDR